MIVKLLLFLMVAAAVRASHQEDDYDGPFLPNGCPSNHHVHWLLPHDSDCAKFYQCNFGERVERDCAPGTLFNYWANPGPVCDWPENVNCELTTTTACPPTTTESPPTTTDCPSEPTTTESPPPTTDCPTEPTTTESPPTTTDCPPEPTTTVSTTTSTEPPPTCPPTPTCPPPPTCPPDEPEPPPCPTCEGCPPPWAHETDCDKFWICVDNNPVLVTCSEGLHFNPETGTCDFICNARCVRSHVQATAHLDGLKIFMPWDQVDDEIRHTYQK